MSPRIYVGRYDPKFVGVTIRAADMAEVHSFRTSEGGWQTDVEVLTGLSDEAVVEDVSRQTVLDHEVRHFHDALLYPLGHRSLKSRIHAARNGFTLVMELRSRAGEMDTLPVPLQDWLVTPQEERDAFVKAVQARSGRTMRIPSLPVVPVNDDLASFLGSSNSAIYLPDADERLVALCRLTLGDYRLLERFWRSPHRADEKAVVPTTVLWEVAGLSCQFESIRRRTSDHTAERFLVWVERYGPVAYRRGLAVLGRCLDALGWSARWRNVLAVTAWAQMGAFLTETDESAAAWRLSRLVEAAEAGRRWSDALTFVDLVESWDEVVGSNSLQTLCDAGAQFERWTDKALREGLALDNGPVTPELLLGVVSAQQKMLRAFLDVPDAYVDPVAYIDNLARYPVPSVGITFPVATNDSTDWADGTPTGWAPDIPFDVASSLAVAAEVVDSIFLPGDRSLQASGRGNIRNHLRLEPLRVIR